jgi:hypothetical protein
MTEIQFLADLLDQLDLALDQLVLNDRNHDRFALILVDNAAELALRSRIKDIADIELVRNNIILANDEQKRLRRALGREFDEKVKFGVSKGWLNKEQSDAIIGLHGFRNTSYHQGHMHETILHSIAISYFRLVCEFLVNYKVGSYSTCSSDKVSYRAMKYLGKSSYVRNVASLTEAFQRMLDISLTLGDSLIDDLSSDMGSAIAAANSSISFISGSSETQERRDWAVVFAQAFVFTQADDAKEKAKDMGFNPLKEKQLFDWLIDDYHEWPFLKDPVPNWQKRLKSLRSEKNPNKAIKKYCDFMKQTNDIRLTLDEVESEIDSYIELQAEILRGK